MARVSKKRKRRPRSQRSRWNRARYRRRRFYAVLVLACLFFGVGTQAAAYFEPETTQVASSADGAKSVNTTERLAASLDLALDRIDRWASVFSRREIDLTSLSFLAFFAAGIFQVFKGRALPAGVTLFAYAMRVLPVTGGPRERAEEGRSHPLPALEEGTGTDDSSDDDGDE